MSVRKKTLDLNITYLFFSIALLFIVTISFLLSLPSLASESTSHNKSDIVIDEENVIKEPNHDEMIMIAKVIYLEARGISNQEEQAAIGYVILNRVNSDISYFPDTIKETILQKNQFAYREDCPVVDDYGRNLLELAYSVYYNQVNKIISDDTFWYYGDLSHNYFYSDYDKFVSDYNNFCLHNN